jgi:hypothetical protein
VINSSPRGGAISPMTPPPHPVRGVVGHTIDSCIMQLSIACMEDFGLSVRACNSMVIDL